MIQNLLRDATPKSALAVALIVILISSATWNQFRRWNRGKISSGGPPRSQKAPYPSALFVTPRPEPILGFDLSNNPEKYRPCRHGPNHVTMGIRRLGWNDWIQLDSDYFRYHDLKKSELTKDLAAHVQYVDNAVTRDACFELLEELTAYLTARYPSMFQLTGGILKNTATGEEFQYPAREFRPVHCPREFATWSDGFPILRHSH